MTSQNTRDQAEAMRILKILCTAVLFMPATTHVNAQTSIDKRGVQVERTDRGGFSLWNNDKVHRKQVYYLVYSLDKKGELISSERGVILGPNRKHNIFEPSIKVQKVEIEKVEIIREPSYENSRP